jgi:fructose-1,6-bisphosphatase/inositol monophosphatase family enzyme
VVGVIAMPALGEMVYAGEGGGCWHVASGDDPGSARRARVSGVRELREATVCTTSLDYFAKVGRERAYERLGAASGMLRGWSDCYAHVLVATGRVEAAVDPSSISRWDVAGMPVIMAEAGGRYSDLEGRAGAGWRTGLSTNGLVHEAVLEVLRDGGDARSQGVGNG